MDTEEREWLVQAMAWAWLQHWLCGRAAGEAARAWLVAEIDARRDGRHITGDLAQLEARLNRAAQAGSSRLLS